MTVRSIAPHRPTTQPENVAAAMLAPLIHIAYLLKARLFRPEDVPVGAIAQTLHSYAKSGEPVDVHDIADFALITSQLALMKSRSFLPLLEYAEEDAVASLEGEHIEFDLALEPYQPATDALLAWLDQGNEMFARLDHTRAPARTVQSTSIPVGRLSSAFNVQIHEALTRHIARVTPPSFIRVEVAASALRKSLKRLATVSLIRTIRDGKLDRRAVVVYFLAVLEMARNGHVGVHQVEPFSDILLESRPHIGGVSCKSEAVAIRV